MQKAIDFQVKQFRRGLITELEYYQQILNIAIIHNKNRIQGLSLNTIIKRIEQLEKDPTRTYN